MNMQAFDYSAQLEFFDDTGSGFTFTGKTTKFYWVGAYQQTLGQSSWSWVDGSPFVDGMWRIGEPDNINSGRSLCVDSGSEERDMKLHDHYCDHALSYICEVAVERM